MDRQSTEPPDLARAVQYGLWGGLWVGLLDMGVVVREVVGWEMADWNVLSAWARVLLLIFPLVTAPVAGATLTALLHGIHRLAVRLARSGRGSARQWHLALMLPVAVALALYLGDRPLVRRTLGSFAIPIKVLLALAIEGLLYLLLRLTDRVTAVTRDRRGPGVGVIRVGLLAVACGLFALDLLAFPATYLPLHFVLALLCVGASALAWHGTGRRRSPPRHPLLAVVLGLALVLGAMLWTRDRSPSLYFLSSSLTVFQQKAFIALLAPQRWSRRLLPARVQPPRTARQSPTRTNLVQKFQLDPEHRPNLILISYDSVPAAMVPLYGEQRPVETPALAMVGRHGLVFDAAFAPAPDTNLVVASWAAARPLRSLSGVKSTPLYSRLRERGYHLLCVIPHRWTRVFAKDLLRSCHVYEHYWQMPRIEGAIQRFLMELKPGEPFFFQAHLLETHAPWADSPFTGRGAGLLGALQRLDRRVKGWLDQLQQRGLLDNTLVVMTADHGEAFGEHGGIHGHASTLYDEQVRVPLIIWTSRMNHQHRIATPVSTGWLGPTLLTLAGVSTSSPHILAHRPVFISINHLDGVVDGHHKLIYDSLRQTLSLYDLRGDPGERRNRAHQAPHAAVQSQLLLLLEQHLGRRLR